MFYVTVSLYYRRWAGWIREKVRLARVTEYRQLFDEGTPVTWLPYIGEEEYTVRTFPIHRVIAPMVCFHGIQWHRPDRVLRQFGMAQPIGMWEVPEGDTIALLEITMCNLSQMASLMRQCVML
ncbi:Serine/threonine-protein phosphatase 7 long form homolog [Linum grandiflorum]